MNTHHDALERMLGRDLHDQVDGMSEVRFVLDDVKGRARRIRRNRRIATGVGVAAALAVILPGVLTAGGMLEGTDDIQPAPSPDVPAEVSRTTLTLRGLERGEPPMIEYFTPDGVVLPGEGTRPLPESYQALVPSEAHGGWIALGAGRDEVRYLSEDLEAQGGSASGNRLTTTPERDLVAWTVPGPGAQTMGVHSTTDPEQVVSWEFPELPVVDPVGILGPDSVVYETTTPRGPTSVGIANPDGTTTELPYLGVIAADPVNGLMAVQTKTREGGACFAVVAAATRAIAWETCDHRLGTFSPDGRYVMATAADSDGFGLSVLHVLDAQTGEPVAQFSSQARTLVNLVFPVWESADTIVAAAAEGTTLTLVRLGVDGTLEEVVDAVEGSAYDFHYYLGADRTGL